MSVSVKKHIVFVSMLVVSFAVMAEELRTQAVKVDTVENDELLIDDLDQDILSVSKSAPVDTAKIDSVKGGPLAKVKESDEELILDGGAEDLLSAQKAIKITDSTKTTDSIAKPIQPAAVPENSDRYSRGRGQSYDNVGSRPVSNEYTPASSEPAKIAAQTPATIESAHSINFARNLKEYRSPKIAMLLSLLLPGAGEIYAKNGVRATIFGVAEAGVIAAGVAYSVKGKNQTNEAHRFADQNYGADNFKKYYKNFKKIYPGTVDTIFEYYDVDPEGFSKSTKDYYEHIKDESSPFVQGWKDVEPQFDTNFQMIKIGDLYQTKSTDSSYMVHKTSDTAKSYAYGFSKNLGVYNGMLNEGTKSYRVSQRIFTLLLVNHIASAIDAGICAKAYNDMLLGKQSLWQRINIRDLAVNSGSGIASGYALEVRF